MTDDDTVQRRLARLTRVGSDPTPPTDPDNPTGRGGPVDHDCGDLLGSGDPAEPDNIVRRHGQQPAAFEIDDSDAPEPSAGSGRGAVPAAFSGATARLPAFDPGRRGVRALAVVAVVVIAVAAVLAWRARPRVEPVPSAGAIPAQGTPVPTAADGPGPAGRPDTAGPGPTGAAGSTQLVVAVTGRVHRPGLVTLPDGARVADALAAAGGALPDTDIAWLNLARRVQDGELVVVGVTPPPGAVTGPVPAGGQPGESGKVDLNAASQQQLETLPGVGPVLAQRIIDHRERVGGFTSVNDLRKVSGIGDARFDQLRELVTV